MNCRDFELGLEAFLADELAPDEQASAIRHLDRCDRCEDLLALARLAFEPADPTAATPPPELIAGVLEHTTGGGCAACEALLCDHVDGVLAADRRREVADHLAGCSGCRELAGGLRSLADDLPRLADIRPDRGFVADVLAATLPWPVRARRWWQATWPRWIRRPRFALEAAYVTTLILVLIFSVPGSPLQAMPGQAIELARRTAPERTVLDPWGRLAQAFGRGLDALSESEGARAVVDSWRVTLELGSSTFERSVEAGEGAYEKISQRVRTFWHWLASVLERAGETPSPADPESDEERP